MHRRIDAGVVVENAVENVCGLARRAGDDLGGIDAEAIGQMRVDADRLIVIAEVAGMVGADQRTGRCCEALTVRGGKAPVALDSGK
jgi:hypothetical protein